MAKMIPHILVGTENEEEKRSIKKLSKIIFNTLSSKLR